ncbi:MAG: GHMP kinase [Candidatus Delongbacteria bacterium]|jgi:galactokinase|nr:GHMP kinase [Candidatus Delongbacteria bacterium]
MHNIKVSTPGRICLFGEHQDYLGLPVMTSAIDLRVQITATPRTDQIINISLPDIDSSETLDISAGGELEYTKKRDYFKSVYNTLKRNGLSLPHGYDCEVRGNIPINSGTSSSSALNNVWCKFLIEADGNKITIENREVGRLSFLAEVVEFNEPGGMMDQYATALGNIQFMDFRGDVSIDQLDQKLGSFVLGDSGEPKDTMYILGNVKDKVLSAVEKIKIKYTNFDLFTHRSDDSEKFKELLTDREYEVLEGALINREFTFEALELFKSDNFDHIKFGKLLSAHHKILDEKLNISTPKINRMISSAIEAGAFGGKINGSGGGGCMFVYAPENPEKVAETIEKEGGKAYIVNVGEGLKVETS